MQAEVNSSQRLSVCRGGVLEQNKLSQWHFETATRQERTRSWVRSWVYRRGETDAIIASCPRWSCWRSFSGRCPNPRWSQLRSE